MTVGELRERVPGLGEAYEFKSGGSYVVFFDQAQTAVRDLVEWCNEPTDVDYELTFLPIGGDVVVGEVEPGGIEMPEAVPV